MSRFSRLEFDGDRGDASGDALPSAKACEPGERHYLDRALQEEDRANFEAALRLYARALDENHRSLPGWGGQLRMFIELGNDQEASAWADKALEMIYHAAELLAAKAVALARLGDPEAALVFSDEAVEIDPAIPYPWLARADVLLTRGETSADFCIQKALAAGPGDWRILGRAARIHARHGQLARALALIMQAIPLQPGAPILWIQRGECEAALGSPRAARLSFRQALDLDPACEAAGHGLSQLNSSGLMRQVAGWWRRAFGR
jgi:tetratricopeptide (TPR) repeat protein